MRLKITRALKNERGSVIIEYALLAGLMGTGAIVALTQIGVNVSDILNAVAGEL